MTIKQQKIKFYEWVSWQDTAIVTAQDNIEEGYKCKIENDGITYNVVIIDENMCKHEKALVEVQSIEDPELLYNKVIKSIE